MDELLQGLCNLLKQKNMNEVKGIVKAMIPVALGVAAGMLIYEQIKKATNKATVA
jgi:hypothetical protein